MLVVPEVSYDFIAEACSPGVRFGVRRSTGEATVTYKLSTFYSLTAELRTTHERCIKSNWGNTESVRTHFMMLLFVANSYGIVEGGICL